MKIGVVTPVMKGGEKGGAEAFYEGLVKGLRMASYDVDQIEVCIDETTFDTILEAYVTCYDLDLHQYDVVISTKAPTYMVRHPNHISYLLHTMRVFYDMFHQAFGVGSPEHYEQRQIIHAFDKYGLHPDRVRRHFTIGHTPYTRLCEADPFWRQIAFQVLHPAPALEHFKEPRPGEYIFLPGRLHRWKRVDLVLKAFRHVKQDIPLKIAGSGEDEPALRELAAGDPRIEFLGRVSEEQLLDLYARALVVPFVPIHEDYGLITIEAFRSKKPVITCSDSGEPTCFVQDCKTGFVVAPEPQAIAEKLNYYIDHPEQAAEMGENGCKAIAHITWDAIVATLLASVELPDKREREWIQSPSKKRTVQVLITDNQCIEPAIGGGRLRLLGLYSTLTEGLEATYVGTYDWPEPQYREIQLSQKLREIDVPLSDEHFTLNAHLNTLLPGKTIIDVTIPWFVQSSQALVETVQKHAREAEVIIFSHPWMYGCLCDLVRGNGKLLIYDAHNCEALLRERLLGNTGLGGCLAQSVKWIEGLLCQESDLILACSAEDKQAFMELYGLKSGKIAIVPNGVDVETIHPVPLVTRAQAKAALSINAFTALFIGSAYPPNIEAAQLIIDQLAPANPDVIFVIVGGVCECLNLGAFASKGASNVKLLGVINNAQRDLAYAAADIALNPMLAGSGTNIKMLDFFAAGLPTIATPVGARGIINRGDACFIVDNIDKFTFWIKKLREDHQLYARFAVNSRKLAEEQYNWHDLSMQLGEVILELLAQRGISVVIPSYERPQLLIKLLLGLNSQTFKNFEVIVIDQSAAPLALEDLQCNFTLQYIHTQEKGAVKARNTGIKHAKGQIIAFTDDDCEPDPEWLAKAYEYFKDQGVVGIEGFIKSDQSDKNRYRIVTNEGFEGLGFMTANLFLRRDILDKIGGFDERFDHPHFREDTDIAWRALAYGQIPFAHDVQVFHPAHPRDIQRESSQERAKFFVQDPLLFYKHPERYVQLLKAEKHYANTTGFWEYFIEGMGRHKVPIPLGYLRDVATAEQFSMLQERMQLLCLGES